MPEAFLVEGQMEQRIIQKLCPGKVVRLIGCNGDDVTMGAIANAVDARLRRLINYSPVIILLDRERRQAPCEELIQELTTLLDGKGYGGRYIVGMPDRTIENWILSDWQHILELCPDFGVAGAVAEGCYGKSVIRKLLPDGTIYHETTLGVELFLKVRPDTLFVSNGSFRRLVERLQIECWWLRGIDERFTPKYLRPA
ncbi:hypothetical protein FRZ44_15570 [Hypericibacter terrae]|uniref:DUF4276 family protein n=1 Tax=Hypericibacter terrae TaxID=2602015 RepID=A0A5J6MFI4_9PROT|nr:DUF4276 family protein [Hypericibacter terrae]QEX16264.1 hypothetical protein FRZ44_15570 [Hypericibacter terrae]